MIRFSFSLLNFTKEIGKQSFNFNKTYLIAPHKAFEYQFSKFAADELFSMAVDLHWWGRDHAGPELEINLVGLFLNIKLYDTRHWNYRNGCWTKPGENPYD